MSEHHKVAIRPPGLDPESLRRVCAHDELPFASTDEAPAGPGVFGQRRAFEAVAACASMPTDGYNLFATGPAGTGKEEMLRGWLQEHAASRPAPPDLVTVCNFGEPLRPHALRLPSGRAKGLATDVEALVTDARADLARAFISESYRGRHRELHDGFERRRLAAAEELERRAAEAGVAIQLTPSGAITVPISGGRPLQPDEVRDMPAEVRERFEAACLSLQEPIESTFVAVRELERELNERHRALNREVALFAIGHLVSATQERWKDCPRVTTWLDALRDDAVDHLERFRPEGEEPSPLSALLQGQQAASSATFFDRYVVNVLVSHDPAAGAPVVVANDPSFYDLFGRIEYETAFGAATTDHRHLRAGLIHQASGGFLVLQAMDVLSKPLVWPRLKDVLRTGSLKIENMAVQYMLFPGVTLDAEPAEVHVTVVLVGPSDLYELVMRADEDVARLFKLRADFDDEMQRCAEGIQAYAGLLAQRVRHRELPPLDRGAIAAIVEYGGRLAGHQQRLSTSVRELEDVTTEAGNLAVDAAAAMVGTEHVAAALAARRRRSNRLEERIREETLEGTVHIDVSGAVTGQVNGLAVALIGDHPFGHPVRITATVAPGEGEVVDIDREARLSGPVHAKGVLILSGYLAGRYFIDRPMTLRASIVFEQSYGPVEGDSASTAELLALLSALARLPVDQGVAVTGAIDQHGNVHAVGGVNEKIEGFFDLCDARGLTGRQGVIVPHANVPHLMLDERVVRAAREGRFRIWPVRTVDEALTLVTGSETAGELVRERLIAMAEAARRAAYDGRGKAGRGNPAGQASPVAGSTG